MSRVLLLIQGLHDPLGSDKQLFDFFVPFNVTNRERNSVRRRLYSIRLTPERWDFTFPVNKSLILCYPVNVERKEKGGW